MENLSENIQLGRLHLALAVDRIDDDLRRLIEFLNLISRDDIRVTALQLSYVRHGDLEMLIPSTFGGELAASKGVRSQSHVHWTWDDFISSLTSPSDQELAQALRDLAEKIPSTGSHEKFWFGRQPNGGIFFHIHGGRYAPFQLWRSRSGELRVFGNWTVWPSLQNDDGFAYIANALSQSHLHGARSIPVHSLDLDTFWPAAVATDLAINT